MTFNASDKKQVREAEKREKIRRAERQGVILSIMASPAGRHYIHDRLVACHTFSTPFTGDSNFTAFNCGQQNVGFQLLGDVIAAAPDQYITMMREATERDQADGGDTSGNANSGQRGDSADAGGDNSGRPDDGDGSDDGDEAGDEA